MPTTPDEIQRRETVARAAINQAFGTGSEEDGVTLFVSHHLEELDSGYWNKHLATETPDPRSVLELLVLRKSWGGDDAVKNFDFTLPEEVTNYVICVKFSKNGNVSDITMES